MEGLSSTGLPSLVFKLGSKVVSPVLPLHPLFRLGHKEALPWYSILHYIFIQGQKESIYVPIFCIPFQTGAQEVITLVLPLAQLVQTGTPSVITLILVQTGPVLQYLWKAEYLLSTRKYLPDWVVTSTW